MSKDFYIYGKHVIIEALRNNPTTIKRIYIKDSGKQSGFDEIRILAKRNNIPVNGTTDKQIDQWLKDPVNHQGVIALSKPYDYATLDDYFTSMKESNKLQTVVILDHIMDVSNVGAIIRSAAGLAVDAIIVAELNQASITSAVFKTSAGTVGKVPIIQIGNINQCIEAMKKEKFWVVGLSVLDQYGKPAQTVWEYQFDTNVAIVIGNEGSGVREKTMEHCDTLLQIPMTNDVESLNASVTVGIVAYEILKQRAQNN